MKLATYLSDNGLTTADFAARVGISQAAVSRYANRRRVPRKAILNRIVAATGGQVTANDFFGEKADAA